MQFSIATIALLAAAASALPGDVKSRQATFTEVATYKDSGCQKQDRTGTKNLVDITTCQELGEGIISAEVDLDLPRGCQLTFFPEPGCAGNTIKVPGDQVPHKCFEFGKPRQVRSVIASGTCSTA